MCIDFYGYHSGGSSFVYVNDFWVITKIVCIPTGISSTLRKKKKQVKSPSTWYRSPDSVRIRQSGRTGNRGVTMIMVNGNEFVKHASIIDRCSCLVAIFCFSG